jgi:transposase
VTHTRKDIATPDASPTIPRRPCRPSGPAETGVSATPQRPSGPVNRQEELRYLLALARTSPARSEVSSRLFASCDWGARADVPEVTTLAKMIEAWWPQILAFTGTGITNAATEASNRLIKDTARIASGFRNPGNQRRRVRLHCKRTIISQPMRG